MKLYLAAVYSNAYRKGSNSNRYAKLTEFEKSVADSAPNILESYHYVHKDSFVRAMRKDGARVFLDSGAFSAHTLGVDLSITEYVRYIQRNKDIILDEDGVTMASVLDGIGDALKTWQNQDTMERLGVTPLPCFHFGEDIRYLEHYLSRYPYITLGGMVGRTVQQLQHWLDPLWERYLVDPSGNPRLKVHAFGITSVQIMQRYPWYSVDSSSWIQTAAFGNVFHPKWGPLSVSDKSPSRKQEGRHISTFAPIEQEAIRADIANAGFEIERLATVYEARAAFNMAAYQQVGKDVFGNREAFRTPQSRLF